MIELVCEKELRVTIFWHLRPGPSGLLFVSTVVMKLPEKNSLNLSLEHHENCDERLMCIDAQVSGL